MKYKELLFPHPIKILQVYSFSYLYFKEERSADRRGKITDWQVRSKSGHITDGNLYLPDTISDHKQLGSATLITLEDYNYSRQQGVYMMQEPQLSGYNLCMNLSIPADINIFQLKQVQSLELHLNDNNETPKRKGYKIGELRPHEPLVIKINFKSFNPLIGTERFLEERTYSYEYLGDFDRCYLMREPYDPVVKHIPANGKVVDLLKPLWM